MLLEYVSYVKQWHIIEFRLVKPQNEATSTEDFPDP